MGLAIGSNRSMLLGTSEARSCAESDSVDCYNGILSSDVTTCCGGLLQSGTSFLERILVERPTQRSHVLKWIYSFERCLRSRKLVIMRFSFASCFFVKYLDVAIEHWYSLVSSLVPRLGSLPL